MYNIRIPGKYCWICGSQDSLTGEHIIKKSDLKRRFGASSFAWMDIKGNKKQIQGLNSKILKFPNSICENCNNSTTQESDLAYQFFLDKHEDKIFKQLDDEEEFYLNDICNIDAMSTEVNRYFSKHIGCQLQRAKFPIPRRLSQFVLYEFERSPIIVSVRAAPFVWQDDATGEISTYPAHGGIVLFKNPIFRFWPELYQTAYMIDGIQFVIKLNLNFIESLELFLLYRNKFPVSTRNIERNEEKYLGM